jgi:predicted transcriptional regulator
VKQSKKRARVDIYADILEVLKHRPEGALVTRISYGAGLPLDRVKPMLEALANFGLLTIRISGDSRFYHITRRGVEFIEAYRKVQSFMTYLGSDQQ